MFDGKSKFSRETNRSLKISPIKNVFYWPRVTRCRLIREMVERVNLFCLAFAFHEKNNVKLKKKRKKRKVNCIFNRSHMKLSYLSLKKTCLYRWSLLSQSLYTIPSCMLYFRSEHLRFEKVYISTDNFSTVQKILKQNCIDDLLAKNSRLM